MTCAQQRVIGRYVLGDALAAGGMATVHFGRLLGPAGFSRTVAIKQLRPGLPSDEDSLATFLDEARLASRIHHPNVVAPIDVVLLGHEAFIVMEYVHGESLSRLIKCMSGAPVPVAIATAIMAQVLLGLHAAHRALSEDGAPLDLVHRDVSPQNILITPEGVARLLDFGIAKAASQSHHTMNGVLKGKLAYMSPEQVTSSPVDCRTDIFAAATVFWEMLTGHRLFVADTPAGCAQKILHGEITAPSQLAPGIPRELDDVVLRALGRDPAARFPDAQAMALSVSAAVQAASSLEVGAWVTKLCGDALLARGNQIAEFEALPLDELTLGLPPMSFGMAAPASAQAFGAQRSERGRAANERAIPYSGEYVPDSAGPSSRRSRLRRRALLVSAGALTLGTLTVAGTHAMQRLSQSSTPRAVAHAALTEPLPVALTSEPVPALDSVATSTVAAVEHTSPSEPPRRSTTPVRRRASTEVVKPSPSIETTQANPSKPAKRASTCDIPYTIDEHGVKRFNPDCL